MAKHKDTQNNEKDTGKKIDIDIEIDGISADEAAEEKAPKSKAKASVKEKKEADDRSGQDEAEQDKAAEEIAALNDKYLRLAAEYDNFRKRNAKERDTTYSNAKADVVNRLLPVYDNLERAIKMECADEAYYKGIEMTMEQLSQILKDMGVLPIPTTGEPFDPNLHEAVARIDSPDTGEGIIADVCQKGFIMGERVIRHSKVVVAN